MAHQNHIEVAVSAAGSPRDSQELMQSVYDDLDVPPPQRETHLAIAQRIRRYYEQKFSSNGATGPTRRPRSLSSTRSTSGSTIKSSFSSARSSRTSTQLSLASSRTSHCSTISDAPQTSFHIPVLASISHNTSSNFSIQPSLTKGEDLPLAAYTKLVCPWCDVSFKKLHDFKRHVHIYCCGRRTWICQNPECTHYTYQKKQANDHCHHTGSPSCKRHGWKTLDLQCDRKHFGCAYCATYFSDLDTFLHHLTKDCGPKDKDDRGHQSSRIIALLRQPPLRPRVEALSLQFRNSKHAYLRLHWSWTKPYMAGIIEQLEYGLKTRVDRRNPGIAVGQVDEFLGLLIIPSKRSQDIVEFATKHARAAALRTSACKPLPPLPESDFAPNAPADGMNMHTESCDGEYETFEEAGSGADPTEEMRSGMDMSMICYPQNADVHQRGPVAVNVEYHTSSELSNDTPAMGLSDFIDDDSDFAWQHLSDTICSDLAVGETWNFATDPYDCYIPCDINVDPSAPMEVEQTLTV